MKQKAHILVIDDEPAILKVMEGNLRKAGYRVSTADDGLIALEKIKHETYDTIVADYLMPHLNGLQLIEQLKNLHIDTPVIVVTAHGSIEHAVQAMDIGAMSYLTKPINYDELLSVVAKAVEQQRLRREVKELRARVKEEVTFDNIIGKNEKMQAIFELIRDVAETDATVLIRGETGTGKELIARALHHHSPFKNEAFVRVNCAALTETLLESELFGHEKGAFTGAYSRRIGRFEQADGGTIFLDEVGDISLSTQSKLLRVLQEKEFERVGGNQTITVNVRIIAATNRELEADVAEGRFREDLFYRLNVIPIELPPLRERIDDIPLLVFHFLERYNQRFKKKINGISPEAVQFLISQDWPGNIRQLQNVIERAVIKEKTDEISYQTISSCLKQPTMSGYQYFINENIPFTKLKQELIEKFEREYISRLLVKHKGNISAAARAAGIHYKNFCEKMKRYQITKWDYREE
ncbi:MAG TPA: sigma-54-dependent Fis family transcriptional regulator [Caldithrix abyssi]|uniref:Sigma-54-dependent Fis family transcriptional regulator n=1 Tax=Caldithrix abyssi TaxID=187145 RepID=A0A7V4WWN8_CALAY|nr:sigma-54-dependent Fis family transcriptional regulator [Caldithrix abyssi]